MGSSLRRLAATVVAVVIVVGWMAPCLCAGDTPAARTAADQHCGPATVPTLTSVCCCAAGTPAAPAIDATLTAPPLLALLTAAAAPLPAGLPYIQDTTTRALTPPAPRPDAFAILRV